MCIYRLTTEVKCICFFLFEFVSKYSHCGTLNKKQTLICDFPTTFLLDARGLPDYLPALFHQSKRSYAENVKAKAMRNEIR